MDRRRSRDRQNQTGEQSSSQAEDRASPSNRLEARPNGPQSSAEMGSDDLPSAQTYASDEFVAEMEQVLSDGLYFAEGLGELADDHQPREVAVHEEVDDLIILEAISSPLVVRPAAAATQPRDVTAQEEAELLIAEAIHASWPAHPAARNDHAPSDGMGVIPVDDQGVPNFAQQGEAGVVNDNLFIFPDDDVRMDAVEIWPPHGHQDADPEIGPMLEDDVVPRRRRRLAPATPSSIVTRSARRAAAAATAGRSDSPRRPRRYLNRSPSAPSSRNRYQPNLPLPDYDEDLLRISQEFNERFPVRLDTTHDSVDRILADILGDRQQQLQQLRADGERLPESDEDEVEIIGILERSEARLDMRIVGYGAENVEERQNIEREKREREERIKKAVEANNNSDSLFKRYTRACGICTTPNPPVRYALYACGHMICAACVEQVTRVSSTKVTCPFCRATTGYVRLFEVEEEIVDDLDGPAAEAGAGQPPVAAAPSVAVTSGRRKRVAPSSAIQTRSARRSTLRGSVART